MISTTYLALCVTQLVQGPVQESWHSGHGQADPGFEFMQANHRDYLFKQIVLIPNLFIEQKY